MVSESILADRTKYQTGWIINSRHSFLTALEVRGPRSGCQHGSGSGEGHLPVCRLPTVSSPGGRAGELCGVS